MLKHGALVKYHLATITHDLFYLHGWGLWMLMLKSILHMFCCFGSNSSECKSHWSYNSSPMKSIGLMRSKPWVKCYMISGVCNTRLWWTQLGFCFISSVDRKANRVRKQSVPLITWWGWAACFWNEYLLSQSENETQTAWFFAFEMSSLLQFWVYFNRGALK